MISLLVTGTHNDLLEEGKGPVDVGGFLHSETFSVGLLCPLVTSEIDHVELGGDDFLSMLNGRTALYMDCEDGMASRRGLVDAIVSNRAVLLTLKECIQRFLLILAVDEVQSLDDCFSVRCVLDCNVAS